MMLALKRGRLAMVAALSAALCAALLLVPVTAGAQTPTTATTVTSFKKIPVTGKARNGKKFNGRFTVQRFASRHGKAYAVGTLTGKLGKRHVRRSNVRMPVGVGDGASDMHSAATCPILHLTLGPLDLNLLGLKVHLNQVVLIIDAQSGSGQLLGNLLCSVANLLNNSALPTNQVAALLNIVQQILNVPAILTL
jgi:hypothetical protein